MTIPTFTSDSILTAGELNTALADTAAQAITDMVAQVNTFAEVQTFGAGLVSNAGVAIGGVVLSAIALASTTTAGAITAAAAQIAGLYLADGATQTAAFTVTTDTAANILAAMPNAVVGTTFEFWFINNDQSSTGYAGTLAAGTGVTISTLLPNGATGQRNRSIYVFTFTAIGSSPALTVNYIAGSGVA
jgi:hypothetical protein